MEKFSLQRMTASGKLCYHFLALVGLVSTISLLLSWISADAGTKLFRSASEPAVKDVNVSTAEAAASVEAYKWRVGKDQTGLPKGYFMSRESLMKLLQDPNNNGVYFYPGYSSAGKFCLVAEGGRSENAGYKAVDGVDGMRIMSESICPTDCGNLTK